MIKYIVVHYTAGNGDTARGNVDYFARTKNLDASAHYFIDENEVCCSVDPIYTAYHCGALEYVHPVARNFNSIGVEMCSRKDSSGSYYFHTDTIKNAAEFIRGLMKTYNIPIDRVIRHYDVSGKLCPRPLIDDITWGNFKKLIQNPEKPKEVEEMKYYEKLEDLPEGEFREVVQKLVDRGTIKGTGEGLHLSEDLVRTLVFLNREGIFK